MKLKSYLLLLVLSVALCFSLAPIGSYGHHWKLLTASLLYFAATLFFLYKATTVRERWIVAAIMTIPPLAVYLPIHLMDFEETLLSFPSTLAHFTGIGFAFITYASKGRWKYFLPVALIITSFLAAFKGYALWYHKVNFGTYTGYIHYKAPLPVSGVLKNQQPFKSEALNGKVVLLDFWHTRCGVCFQKFPQVQKLFDKYKDNPAFVLLAVNKPLASDSTGQAFAMLEQRGYSFPVLIPAETTLSDTFGVKAYPTAVVINTTGVVVFRGQIERAASIIDQLMANSR